MADSAGIGGFLAGTGTETITLGMTGITRLDINHGSSTTKPAIGSLRGTAQHTIPDENANPVSGKVLQIKNNAGTTVFEATYVSQSAGVLTFNKTINTLGTVTCLFRFGN